MRSDPRTGDRRREHDRHDDGKPSKPIAISPAPRTHAPRIGAAPATYNARRAFDGGDSRGIPVVLRAERPSSPPVGVAGPARRRPLDTADDRGEAAADAVLPRPLAAPGAADDHRAEE